MSRKEREDEPKDNLGYQKKNAEEVDELVKRLSTPRKPKEQKKPDRRMKIERHMTTADIDEMVRRLSSQSRRTAERPRSAYEQGGIFMSYPVTGWDRPGSGGKFIV